jgi:hypothetical protein
VKTYHSKKSDGKEKAKERAGEMVGERKETV